MNNPDPIISKQLYSYATYLLSKDKNSIFNQYDLINESWDFKNTDIKKIKNEMCVFFYKQLKNKNIPFSQFMNKEGEEIPLDILPELKRIKNEITEQSCKTCGETKSINEFTLDKSNNAHKKECKKCRCKRYTEWYKLHSEKRELNYFITKIKSNKKFATEVFNIHKSMKNIIEQFK